ncbi:YihY/virulence factor BrkB family protein [Georgenia sp. Z1491]|uniref:YihY/virulence factor BrkB family protein n=1 Tax=Georgenia sp. Z1491 TaxID=3416707 RepID=UPI003CF8CCC9
MSETTDERAASTADEPRTMKDRALAAWGWIQQSRLWRANQRYGTARGAMLAGGIAYSALFSIFAALAIGWTIFSRIMGGNAELQQTVIDAVNDALPGIIDDGSNGGLISPDQLVVSTALNPASIIAFLVLLWTASSVMSNLRLCIQAMFGINAPPENFLVGRLARPIAGFFVLALAVLATAIASIAVNTIGETLLSAIGVEGSTGQWLLRIGTLAASFVVDAAVFIMLISFTASVRAPRKDLLLGAAIGAVGSGVLRALGTTAVGAVDNPLLAGFAAIATLLLWVNLLARLMLYVSAFIANPPLPQRAEEPEEVHFTERPNYITESVPETKEWPHQQITGVIDVDPSLHPDAVAAREREERLAEEMGTNPGGVLGSLRERRVRRLEEKAERARAELDADTRRTYRRYGPRSER